MAAKQPNTIPGYFDPAAINLYFPTTANGQEQKIPNFNLYALHHCCQYLQLVLWPISTKPRLALNIEA